MLRVGHSAPILESSLGPARFRTAVAAVPAVGATELLPAQGGFLEFLSTACTGRGNSIKKPRMLPWLHDAEQGQMTQFVRRSNLADGTRSVIAS